MTPEDKDILYSRWLNNQLSTEELSALENSGEADVLGKIISVADNWTLPELSKDGFEKVRKRISQKEKVRVLPLYKKTWFIAAAASLVLLVGFFWMFNSGNAESELREYSSLPGQTKQFVLEDSTVVTLFGHSKIEVATKGFEQKRLVKMNGDVHFEVRRKGNFEVEYIGGNVKVLGTKFRVLSDSSLSSVKCFEGKVEVNMGQEHLKLEKGNGVRKELNSTPVSFTFDSETDEITLTETKFENVPLREVCSAISVYFDTKIVGGNVDLNRNFTGRFSTTSLDTALTMVCEPMNISCTKKGKIIYLQNK